MRRFARKPSPSLVISVLALVMAIGLGPASALVGRDSVTSGDVKNRTLKGADIRKGAVRSVALRDRGVRVRDLATGVFGSRAYGRVAPDGALSRSKNVAAVTRPATGIYCIQPSSLIDPAEAVLIVSDDRAGNGTLAAQADDAFVEWDSNGDAACLANTLVVASFTTNNDTADNNDGTGDLSGDSIAADNNSFGFAIP